MTSTTNGVQAYGPRMEESIDPQAPAHGRRSLGVLLKGVVIVLDEDRSAAGETPAIQRVANRPIACHALESLAGAGLDELAVVASETSLAEVRACLEPDLTGGIEPTYLPLVGRNDLVGAIGAAADFIGAEPSILHVGDGLLGQRLDRVLDLPGAESADMTLVLHRDPNEGGRLGAVVERLLRVRELGDSRSRLALTGVCMFGPGVVERVASDADQLAPGAGLLEVADLLAGAGSTVEASVVPNWRRYRGDPLDLLELNRLVLDQQRPRLDAMHQEGNRIEGRVIIDPTATVSSSVVLGPCIIGAHAHVADSYIGPYTSIGAGADIEGAEIVSSIIADGARIRHVNGRIEGSTIGRRSSIFRDFSLPRAMRLHVGDDVQVALQ